MFGCSFSLEMTFGEEAEKRKTETKLWGSFSCMRDESRNCAERMDGQNCMGRVGSAVVILITMERSEKGA